MISLLQKKSLKFFHPFLKRLVKLYLAKPRTYRYKEIKIKVLPGVFHPGLFFSTKVFLEYLQSTDLENKKVLELGAGSGLISIYCSKRDAKVTASDISSVALSGIAFNAGENQVLIHTVKSDLFDKIDPDTFDLILINPPYYPKTPKSIEERAWFCGEEFEYFQKLFKQLSHSKNKASDILMILSEDCQISKIMSIAKKHNLQGRKIFTKTVKSEENYVYQIKFDNRS